MRVQLVALVIRELAGERTVTDREVHLRDVTDERNDLLRGAVRRIADGCPRLVATCYWAGTSAISLEETAHRESFDLDFHSQHALADTRPLLAELRRTFAGSLELVQAPDAFGSGWSGVIELSAEKATLQVFANFDDVPDADLVASSTAPALRRVALHRYLADKVQCVVERVEARDLVDIHAVVHSHPRFGALLRRAIHAQDGLMLAERLLGWTDTGIRDDLRGYRDVDPGSAITMRDELLALVRSHGPRDDES